MTTIEIEVTLQQMLQMALGVPKITNINISILHSLFGIILNKLDSKYEKVEIGGLEAVCLSNILRLSRISPLPFSTEGCEKYDSKLLKLDAMSHRLKEIDQKLEQHFESIRQCNNKTDTHYEVQNWERYSKPCEDLCALPDPPNEIGCKLITNPDFVRRLLRLVSVPLVERMSKIIDNLLQLHVNLLEFKRLSDEKREQIEAITHCVIIIEELRDKIDKTNKVFYDTMDELQQSLLSKVDRINLPALKKYMQNELENITKLCKDLKIIPKCPTAVGLRTYFGDKCLSCEGQLTCQHRPIFIAAEQECPPQIVKQRKYKRSCSKTGPCLTRAQELELLHYLDAMYDATEEGQADKKMKKSCMGPIGEFAVFRGQDRNYYRAA